MQRLLFQDTPALPPTQVPLNLSAEAVRFPGEPQPFDRPLDRPKLRVCVLGSGSGGNSVVVESGSSRILIDAGFSCREIETRLKLVGIAPDSLRALVLTHEHQDHNRGANRLARKHRLPVLATRGTLAGTVLAPESQKSVIPIRSGEIREIAGFAVEPFAIPHDAREPVGLVVEDGSGRRVGLCADIGCKSQLAWGRLSDLDVLLLETNHDLEMLRTGPYPWTLKQRVAGRHGHLSNREAAEGLPELLSERLRWVVLYHLSRTNNLPALAAAAVGEALDRAGSATEYQVSDQFRPSPWLEIL